MFVFHWLFDRRKKESFWDQRQRVSRSYANHSQQDGYVGDVHGNDNYDYDVHDLDELQELDYRQDLDALDYRQDFDDLDYIQDPDDDPDSDIFDDDF